ncbi:MAG TPA: ATP-binding protein [Polyangiaceae bacterium]|nr:ATP-binding protein [Polyangiaceae bacterium]
MSGVTHGSTQDVEPAAIPDALPDGVLILTARGEVEWANAAFLKLTERTGQTLRGLPFVALVADEDVLHLVGIDTVFATNATYDNNVIFTTPEGVRRRLIVSSARSLDGSHIFLTVRATGIVHHELANTARWAATEQDRANELAKVRDALTANNRALQQAREEVERAYAKLKDEVLARERLENELRLAQKLEAIGQLSAGIAHEINTPMQYIGDNVDFLSRSFAILTEYIADFEQRLEHEHCDALRQDLEQLKRRKRVAFITEQVPRAFADSKSGIAHVSTIVRAMKSFAHSDGDEQTLASLNEILSNTLIVAQNEYKNVASVETRFEDLPPIPCYVGRLNQVFLNLIVNAAHAIEAAARPERGKITVSSKLLEDHVEVSIADTGTGIAPHIRHRVFDQFFTTKPVGKGTGQGLSLARAVVVDAHAGTLTFESEEGVGTVFYVRLPLAGRASSTPNSSLLPV